MAGKWHCMLTAFVCMGALGMTIMPTASANNTDGESQDKTTKTSVELRWFNPTVRGSVGGDSYFSERSYEHKLDFEQDLGVTNMNNAPEVKITHGKWSVDYIRMGNDVKGYRLKAPIKHNSKEFKGDLDTDMKMDYVSVNYQQDVVKTESSNYYWTAGAKYIGVSATSSGINGSSGEWESDSDSARGIVPAVGVGAVWQSATAPRWQGSISLNGMPLGRYGHIVDFEAAVRYQPDKNWQVSAGYRVLDMRLHKDDKEVVFQANGPFMGVCYSF